MYSRMNDRGSVRGQRVGGRVTRAFNGDAGGAEASEAFDLRRVVIQHNQSQIAAVAMVIQERGHEQFRVPRRAMVDRRSIDAHDQRPSYRAGEPF